MNRNTTSMILAIVMGAAVGVAFAAVQGNPIWIGVGAVMGIAIGLLFGERQRRS